jgi:hypothetical protein
MHLPESAFISAPQRLASQPGPNRISTIRQGELAQKLEAMKQTGARTEELRLLKQGMRHN